MTAPDPRPDEGWPDCWDDPPGAWPSGWYLVPLALLAVAVWAAAIVGVLAILGVV